MSATNWKTALCASGSAIICGIAIKVFQKMKNGGDSSMNEVLFYGADNEELTQQVGVNNLLCIYYVLMHAHSTIDICVASLRSETLAKCLITVRQTHKVRIRLALHNSKDSEYLQIFSDNGFEIMVISASERLDHEFILVDALEYPDVAVAIIGSIDYDTTKVNGNRDNTLLTSETAVVQSLKREFDRVWNLKSDINEIEETAV